jgi:hypothetical protein
MGKQIGASAVTDLIQVANPSLSQSWSHQLMDTRFPNHWWATWQTINEFQIVINFIWHVYPD